jgi:hypothetical protein
MEKSEEDSLSNNGEVLESPPDLEEEKISDDEEEVNEKSNYV